ncbi:MAG: glycoside hydrolase family 55 protein [Lachnospiraceae bacterium]|nr:glycoside hydrolase family 55 protein [Lachnospiraceae bacterium]
MKKTSLKLYKIILFFICCLLLNIFSLYVTGITTLAATTSTTSERAVTSNSTSVSYITPEQFGAKGDGVTDDTAAFEKCMENAEKNVLLSKTYLIKKYLIANTEKHFYAPPKGNDPGATIICEPSGDSKSLAFYSGVIFENIQFYSTFLRTGISPHGEKYQRTSNVVFVEVWNKTGTFNNCSFLNALIAIRGRKSTSSTVIPENISVNNCSFTECKIPIQGYCENTSVKSSIFTNDGELYRKLDGAKENVFRYNGDLYSGDHCIYMERYGCVSLSVTDCTVVTKNCNSGASFQIYGTARKGDSVPSLAIVGCTISSNGIVSVNEANILIEDTLFNEQQDAQYICRADAGKIVLLDSELNHSYAFCYADSNANIYAVNCKFRLMTSISNTRCNFPLESYKCTYINWGGNIRANKTIFSDCIFTRDGKHVLNSLYISNSFGYKISLINTSFKSGDAITNNTSAVEKVTNCIIFD